MKVLYFNGFFKLPDDFDGKFPDAARELARYREADQDKPNDVIKAGEMPIPYLELWAAFLEHIETGDHILAYSFVGEMDSDGFMEYDEFGELKK